VSCRKGFHEEIRQLLHGFPSGAAPAQRWQQLAGTKLAQMQAVIEALQAKQQVVRRLQRCQCTSLEMCGAKLGARLAAGANLNVADAEP
jgi:hypothetical protein